MGERLRGIPVSPGVAMGPVHFKEDELGEARGRHILAHLVEEEVERFRRAVEAAERELDQLLQRHGDALPASDSQILDVHRAYLEDPTFLSSVERIVRGELLRAESAVARVVADFERVMDLVENESLRARAEDLRDVGLRVLRWMRVEGIEREGAPKEPSDPFILAARRLSIADMFALDQSKVLGILAEEGGVSGHAAILARSMRIPAMTGLEGLYEMIAEGDFVILDAASAEVRIRPEERVLREFEFADWSPRPAETAGGAGEDRTADGEAVLLAGSCGTLSDVDRCTQLGLAGVGVYRTELLFVAGEEPTEEMSLRHYREVLKRAGEAPVTFRLLDIEGGRPGAAAGAEERNPALGLRSIRALLRRDSLLRLQVRALLRAAGEGELNLLVPFVTVLEDLQAVREVVEQERERLAREEGPGGRVSLGAAVEVPAVALTLADFLPQVDFAVISLDDLAQHLLAADRDSLAVRTWYQALHPALFRVLATLAQITREAGKPVGLFGESVAELARLPFYIGAGFRSFSISPVRVPSFRRALSGLSALRCRDLAAQVLALSSGREIQEALAAAQGLGG